MNGSEHRVVSGKKTVDLFTLLISYLDEADLLFLRQINRKLKEYLRSTQKGPYFSKTNFTLATTGLFKNKDNFNHAWAIYFTTTHAHDHRSAILYKLKDLLNFNLNGTLTRLGGLAYLDATGHRYRPDKHTWEVNLSWILAQIHAHRTFVILSEIAQYNNIYHEHLSPPLFSAFAKEIAAVYKAGYRVSLIEKVFTSDGGDHIEITLKPTQNEFKQFSITDITPSDQEILTAINDICDELSCHSQKRYQCTSH